MRLVRIDDEVPEPVFTTPQRLRALCELVELIDYEKARAVVAAGNDGMSREDIGLLLGAELAYVDAIIRHADVLVENARADATTSDGVAGRHRLELVASEDPAPASHHRGGAEGGIHAAQWDELDLLVHNDRYDDLGGDHLHRRNGGRHRAAPVASAL